MIDTFHLTERDSQIGYITSADIKSTDSEDRYFTLHALVAPFANLRESLNACSASPLCNATTSYRCWGCHPLRSLLPAPVTLEQQHTPPLMVLQIQLASLRTRCLPSSRIIALVR